MRIVDCVGQLAALPAFYDAVAAAASLGVGAHAIALAGVCGGWVLIIAIFI